MAENRKSRHADDEMYPAASRLTFRQCLKELWVYLKPNRVKLFIAIAAVLTMQVIYALMPTVEGGITSQLQLDVTAMKNGVPGAHIQMDVILKILGTLGILFLIKISSQFIGAFTLTTSIQKTMYGIRNAVEHKINQLPLSYFDSQKTGDILSRITNDVETVSNALQQTLSRVIGAVCTFVFVLIMMFRISVPMTLIICVGLPIIGFVSSYIVKRSQPIFDRQQAALAALNGTVNEMYGGVTEIMVYNHQKQAMDEFEQVNRKLADEAFKAQFISGTISPLSSFVTYVVIGCCALYGCMQALSGVILIGQLQAFIRYIWNINDPISQISQLSSQVQSAFAGMNRLFTFLNLPEEVHPQSSPEQKQALKEIESIAFEHVQFSYAQAYADSKVVPAKSACADSPDTHVDAGRGSSAAKPEAGSETAADSGAASAQFAGPAAGTPDSPAAPADISAVSAASPALPAATLSAAAPLMKNMNFTIQKGQRIAVVGPTGAGKTTLINLLLRFYDIQGGAIKINGMDIRELSRQDLRDLFGLVLQDAWLFEGTVEENLKYGKENASQKDLEDAVARAEITDLIARMPHGFQTRISASAENVSQGEKQLLTIARALLKDPKVLILDEATSSVDTRLEKRIQKAMDTLMQSRTSIVIAHRLSTITNSDLILVMDHGDIAEAGTHEELLKQNGMYARLYNSQFQDMDMEE